VRELGIPAATAISLASVAVVNTFINFNAGLTAFNQADMTLPLLLGAGVWLVAMFAYKYLLEAIPRAGGEYVYLSRIISPALGALFGIGICIAFTYILAANANFTAQYFPFLLTALGAAFGSSAISDAARRAPASASSGGSARSNLAEASVRRPMVREVWRTLGPLKVADSRSTSLVVAVTALSSPPITPASATGR